MNDDLTALIETARLHKVTPAERQRQRISFCIGQLPEESILTPEDVARMDYELHGNLTEMENEIARLREQLDEAERQRDAARAEVNRALTEIADNCDRAARHEVGRESAMLAAHAAWFRALIPQPTSTISPAEAVSVPREMLEAAVEHLGSVQDEGPWGTGWKSEGLIALIAALRAIAEEKP